MRYQQGSERNRNNRSVPLIILGFTALLAVLAVVIFLTISRASGPARDILVVGTSTGFPPFEMRFGEEVRGLDMDLCGKAAEALGRKMVVRDLAFDALLPSLGRGVAGEKPLVDIVCAATTKTSARDEVVDFSETYFVANQAILSARDKKVSYSSPQDLVGLFVVYQEGTTSQEWFEENVLGKIAVSGHAPFKEMVIALQRLGKDFDVIVIDEPVARTFAKSRTNLAIAGIIDTGEEYAFAVAEGDPQKLLPAVNQALKAMRESGEYDRLIERWFGENEK